jgi:hypothetical protein
MVVVDGKSGNLSFILSSTIVLASSMIFIASSSIPGLLGAMSAVGICPESFIISPKRWSVLVCYYVENVSPASSC